MKTQSKYRSVFNACLLATAAFLPFIAKAADPNAVLCLSSEGGITASGGLVSNWVDTCGNSAWMTTVARRPTLVPGAINGYPVVRFSGAQSLLLTTRISPSQFTIFVVGKNNMPTETFSMILGPGGNSPNNQLRWENGSQALAVGTGNAFPVSISSIGNTRVYHLLTLRYDGSTLKFYRNGVLTSSHSFATSGPWTLAQIGAWYSSYFMRGDIAEIVVYDSAVDEAYRIYYGNYLIQRYAL